MAWTAATSQALVQTTRDALITADKAVQLYMTTNNPGQLAAAITAVAAASAAIAAVSA